MSSMLSISGLTCSYGDVTAVQSVSLDVPAGKITGLIGANGAGKSTVIGAVAGLVEPSAGRIVVNGVDVTRLPTHQRIEHHIALVPEGRRVFADLSVQENLVVGATRASRDELDERRRRVYELFNRLNERRDQLAGSLSGGEQQMLAIGRALMADPLILLVDELSLGLMPIAIDECYRVLKGLRDAGMAILLVEQGTERVLDASDEVAIMESGHIVWTGSGEQAKRDDVALKAYLGA